VFFFFALLIKKKKNLGKGEKEECSFFNLFVTTQVNTVLTIKPHNPITAMKNAYAMGCPFCITAASSPL